jgi:predicted Zn-dependent protease
MNTIIPEPADFRRLHWSEMASKREEALKSMLEQDPGNSFARYGLAMEFVNSSQLEAAVTEFTALLANTPDYVAGYFHGGQTLEKLGRKPQAREMYERGLTVCERVGDEHSAAEMRAALDTL